MFIQQYSVSCCYKGEPKYREQAHTYTHTYTYTHAHAHAHIHVCTRTCTHV